MTVAAGVGQTFGDTVRDGPLLVAAAVAVIAGLVSFLSPCVLPLVPGYLSYVTGLAGASAGTSAAAPEPSTEPTGSVAVAERVTTASRYRVAAGALLFVLGFTAVFVSAGALFGGLGQQLIRNQDTVTRLMGVVTIVMGLAFLGLIPGMQRELRSHRLPRAGLAGAPLLGVTFGLGWTPCIGPTLGAVLGLSYDSATAWRGAMLSVAYCLGLGIPFVLAGLGFGWVTRTFAVVRRNTVWVMRVGGGLLITLGVLLVTGWWTDLMIELRAWLGSVGATDSAI